MEGASVGAGGGGGAVGVAGQCPVPAVNDDQVMEFAQQFQVPQGGGAAVGPVDQMVGVASGWGLVAAGELAVPVPGDHGLAQVRGDGAGAAAHVEGLAEAGVRRAEACGRAGRRRARRARRAG